MPSAFFLSLLPLPFSAALARPSPRANDPAAAEPYTIRRGLARCFAAHGRHVAANQIRVLLICSVVMTTLLYPALAIHYTTVSEGADSGLLPPPSSVGGEGDAAASPLAPASPGALAHPALFLARSLLPVPILALYSFLFIWTFGSLQHFTQVHNRPGVAFTYVVELAASTTCSGSLCVMLGWKLEGVPWFLLPFVITVVGVENMVHVTKAIVTTPVHMTVRERLGQGLAHAGPQITFTTLADILILALVGTILGETAGVVKEFCRFAIIVLVADWFLIFTFFTTVISIDMQRLELAEVLQQGNPTTPQVTSEAAFNPTSTPPHGGGSLDAQARGRRRRGKPAAKSSSEVLVSGFQAILRARTARNGSLMALVSLLFGLWYFYAGGLGASRLAETPGQPLPAAYLASIRTTTPLRSVFRDRAPTWFLQVVCFPIAATTFLVYLILRYLLKDAELLDAQRDRLEIGEEWDEDAALDDGRDGRAQRPTLRTLPTAHQADVSLLATSQTKVLSVGFDGIALVWSKADPTADGVPLPLALGSDRVTHAALDAPGRYCAIATARGAVSVWRLGGQLAEPVPIAFAAVTSSTAVSSIEFLPTLGASAGADSSSASPATLVVVRENGEVAELNCRRASTVVMRSGSQGELVRATPLWSARAAHGESVDLALANSAGQVVVLRRSLDVPGGEWLERLTVQLEAGHRVSKVASSLVSLSGAPQDVLAVTTTGGAISLWDARGVRLIALNPNMRRLGRVALVDSGAQECAGCGQRTDGLLMVAANPDEATLYRLTHESPTAAVCACASTRRSMSTSTQRTSFDRLSFDASPLSRSRGPSLSAIIPPVSPLLHRRIPTSASNASNLSADYPIAGHGVHSRRLSTRDKRAEAEELLLDPDTRRDPSQDDPFTASSSPDDRTASPPPALRAVLLGSVSVRKGAWGVLDTGQIVGVGRPRSSGSSSSYDDVSSVMSSATGGGSSSAAKWRVWQIDSRRPAHGLDLAVAWYDMQSLKEDAAPDSDGSPDEQAADCATPGSALRNRRAARVKAFSRVPSSSTTTVAPSLAHLVVSPLVCAGDGVVYAGMGNALCRLAFVPPSPAPAPSSSFALLTSAPPTSLAAPSPNMRSPASPDMRGR